MAIWQHLFLFNLVGKHESQHHCGRGSRLRLDGFVKHWCCVWRARKASGDLANLSISDSVRTQEVLSRCEEGNLTGTQCAGGWLALLGVAKGL